MESRKRSKAWMSQGCGGGTVGWAMLPPSRARCHRLSMAVPPPVSFDTDSVLGGATAQSSGATAWLSGAGRCHCPDRRFHHLALECWAVPPPRPAVPPPDLASHWLGFKSGPNQVSFWAQLAPNQDIGLFLNPDLNYIQTT
ncbi:hypothetical protein C4D60_Mb09t19100 [Musa balbisiana]|uniref:Uncharacterized protein n=1 Tax=Musa balbisiana TaxID=52838 RepID=A0A4S8IIV0_MUSBA|nr:hypothetical protein C4D60_Mb09t19100 [Musa balbisiana]